MGLRPGSIGPCQDCQAPTVARWERRNGKRHWFRQCSVCFIAQASCSRTHGIESELREKYRNYHEIAAKNGLLRSWYRKYKAGEVDATKFRIETGFSVRGIAHKLKLFDATSEEEIAAYGGFQLDPLGLQRISDDHAFIERFLRGDAQ